MKINLSKLRDVFATKVENIIISEYGSREDMLGYPNDIRDGKLIPQTGLFTDAFAATYQDCYGAPANISKEEYTELFYSVFIKE